MRNKHLVGLGCALTLALPTMSQAAAVDEIEPNNSAAFAQNINASFDSSANPEVNDLEGEDISLISRHATITATGDGSFDAYTFNPGGMPGQVVVLVADIDHASFDAEIFVYDSLGNLVTLNDDFDEVDPGSEDSNDGEEDSFTVAALAADGDYTIVVAATGSNAGSGFPVGNPPPPDATYTLQVALVDLPSSALDGANAEVEPNDDLAGAQLLSNFQPANDPGVGSDLGANDALGGSLPDSALVASVFANQGPASDDFFAFDVVAGQVIGIDTDLTYLIDTVVTVFDPSGTAIASSDNHESLDEASFSLSDSLLEVAAETDGRYTVRVQGASADSAFYLLHVVLSESFAAPVCPEALELFTCMLPTGGAESQSLSIRNTRRRGGLNWTWKDGVGDVASADLPAGFGNPAGTTSYSYCLYDIGLSIATDAIPPDLDLTNLEMADINPEGFDIDGVEFSCDLIDRRVAHGGSNWRQTRNGFLFSGGRDPENAALIDLRAYNGRGQIAVSARDDTPELPLAPTAITESAISVGLAVGALVNSEGSCFSTLHVAPTTNTRRRYASRNSGLGLPRTLLELADDFVAD